MAVVSKPRDARCHNALSERTTLAFHIGRRFHLGKQDMRHLTFDSVLLLDSKARIARNGDAVSEKNMRNPNVDPGVRHEQAPPKQPDPQTVQAIGHIATKGAQGK